MNLDVGKAIRELLYEHPAVIVPGLGAFTSAPENATVDYVQGVVLPPSKKLAFNANLVINDGMLVNHLQQSNVVTFQEAADAVTRYVDGVKQALERREIVEIPQVGRLYKDYEHKIRFMPEGTNFNAEAFGLPTVQFSPVSRERKTDAVPGEAVPVSVQGTKPAVAKAATGAVATAMEDKVASGSSSLAQNLMPWLVLLSAVVLAISIYLIFSGGESKATATVPIDKERLNVKPTPGVDETDASAGAEGDAPSQASQTGDGDPTSTVPEKSIPESADTEEDTYEPGKQTTFIVVHSFGVRGNATKFAQALSEAGYAPETRKADNLYRVGVVFPYKTQQEVADMIGELGKKFDAKPKTVEELDAQN